MGDASKIAHELAHFIVDNEGFPAIGYRNIAFENLSSSLSSSIHDVFVARKLIPYGFDLDRDFEKESRNTRHQLKTYYKIHRRSPTDIVTRLHWIFNYIGIPLEGEAIGGKGNEDAQKLILWIRKLYPDIAREGDDLLDMINRMHFDTPEKTRAVFGEIIRRYDLNRFGLSVVGR